MDVTLCALINSLLPGTTSLKIRVLANFDPVGSNLASESASDAPIVPVSVPPWAGPAPRHWISAVFQFILTKNYELRYSDIKISVTMLRGAL